MKVSEIGDLWQTSFMLCDRVRHVRGRDLQISSACRASVERVWLLSGDGCSSSGSRAETST